MGYAFFLQGGTFQKVLSVSIIGNFFSCSQVIKYAGGQLFPVVLDCDLRQLSEFCIHCFLNRWNYLGLSILFTLKSGVFLIYLLYTFLCENVPYEGVRRLFVL